MTKQELQSQLEVYAKEDLAIAKEQGSVIICETLEGVITINYEDEEFQAFNHKHEQLTYWIHEGRMINFLVRTYDVTDVHICDIIDTIS